MNKTHRHVLSILALSVMCLGIGFHLSRGLKRGIGVGNESWEALNSALVSDSNKTTLESESIQLKPETESKSVLSNEPEHNSSETTALTSAPTAAPASAPTAAPANNNDVGFEQQLPLLNNIQCSKAELGVDKKPTTINFFSCAVGEMYEDLLPMYAFFALANHHSIGAFVEIVVPDSASFIQRHNNSLSWLQNTFVSNNTAAICVRDFIGDHIKRTQYTNTWRYLEVPIRTAKYTFIGDVDIFFVESVLDPMRFKQMEFFGLPYSNIVRDYDVEPEERRLTGVMLVETEKFYTPALIKAQATVNAAGNDEIFLYKIVVEAGIGIPDPNTTDKLLRYRPVHGIHLSLNRGPQKRLCHFEPKAIERLQHVDQVESYLRYDHFGTRYLSRVAADVQEEGRAKMDVIDEKCQSNHTVSLSRKRKGNKTASLS
mmetsp:Transcript_20187/g.29612  ORF Transcript_20187/g.29612 Transcript_20187/m.29612 type:complete len:429 (+) Transcript_20187:131-1417(+)